MGHRVVCNRLRQNPQEATVRNRPLAARCVGTLLALTTAPLAAQIRGSEHAVVTQTIDGTTITIDYSRPVARGRDLFGGVVPWGKPWTGANWATTLEVDKAIRLNGQDVPAGKYSVWIIPRPDRWTVFLDPNSKLFHFQHPDSTPEQIRMTLDPEQGPHVEMLTWTFPAVSGDAGTLRMQWGTTFVPLQIVVQPTKPVALPTEIRAVYLGNYDLRIQEGLGWPTSGRFEVFEVGGVLRGRLPFPIHPGDELEFDLIPAGQHRLSPGLYRDGKVFNVEPGATFEFEVDGNHAAAVRLRGVEGTVFMEGKRGGQ